MKPIPRLLADATSNRNILVRTCPEPLVSALKARFFPDTAISRSSGILVAKVPTLEGKLNTGVASAYDGTAVSFSLDRKAGSREQWAAQIFWIVLQPCASNEKMRLAVVPSGNNDFVYGKAMCWKMPSERLQRNQMANTCRMSRTISRRLELPHMKHDEIREARRLN